jgi:hypothetical protein
MTSEQLMVNVAINNWKLFVSRADKTFSALTADQLMQQIAPGKNRIIYLLGHLTAVHDAMLPLLGLGERLHPELDEIFVSKPDRAVEPIPAADKLKQYWTEVNSTLLEKFEALSAEGAAPYGHDRGRLRQRANPQPAQRSAQPHRPRRISHGSTCSGSEIKVDA